MNESIKELRVSIAKLIMNRSSGEEKKKWSGIVKELEYTPDLDEILNTNTDK